MMNLSEVAKEVSDRLNRARARRSRDFGEAERAQEVATHEDAANRQGAVWQRRR
jgi:hypothetical protein